MNSQIQQHRNIAVLPTPLASYCVFRRGSSWLALSALTVREVMFPPERVFVPGTPDIFAGICHVRSEFIPVVNLESALPGCGSSNEDVMLIIEDADGPWAVLVDEIGSLKNLEVSDSPDADLFDISCIVVGWSTHQGYVVQILDPTRIRTLAERELTELWHLKDKCHGSIEKSGMNFERITQGQTRINQDVTGVSS